MTRSRARTRPKEPHSQVFSLAARCVHPYLMRARKGLQAEILCEKGLFSFYRNVFLHKEHEGPA